MISILENGRTFHLQTKKTSMIFHAMKSGHVVCLYWGEKVNGTEFSYIVNELPKVSYLSGTDGKRDFRLEQYPLLYPTYGNPDMRTPALHLMYQNGARITDLRYKKYQCITKKKKIPGLPTVMDDAAEVLELVLEDEAVNVCCTLRFSVFENYDAITENVTISNRGKESFEIQKVMSSCFSFLDDDFECLTLTGAWARECHLSQEKLRQGTFLVDSKRGASGHGQNPFIGMARGTCTEDTGEVYGMHLVYSGSFEAMAEVDMHQNTRCMMGIQSFDFGWEVEGGEQFDTPETVLIHSNAGLNQMSQRFHRLYRECLVRKEWTKRQRPVVINNWEAMYFDFDKEKLLALAKEAAALGIEMFVLDDGWYGKRNNAQTSLGDWYENTEKLGGTLVELGEEMQKMGLQLGIWMEPEMVCPDSDLFRSHADWIIASPDHEPQLARDQYVLDLSKKCVQDFIIESVSRIIRNGRISYLKWDMNRNITDLYSQGGTVKHQKEMSHRYILGLYAVMEELTSRFPDVLFEGCAGGGGRFDAGMLAYMPQIWASDDTDAIERLEIQKGVSLLYPASSMSCHVSSVPNHQIGRVTSANTRGIVAMQGILGYELNLLQCTEGEKKEIRNQIEVYKQIRDIIQNGKLYRLNTNDNQYAWMYISEDEGEILISCVQVLSRPNTVPKRLKLKGLEKETRYRILPGESVRTGSELMQIGLKVERSKEDFEAFQWLLKPL